MKLTTAQWNNIFSYNERKQHWSQTIITIPDRIQITSLDQVRLGHDTVFEEIDHHGIIRSCTGLMHRYELSLTWKPIVITDNHNHVLPYRLDIITTHQSKSVHLIHIDQHSDLWPNSNTLDLTQIHQPQYQEYFAHQECNIWNFIPPCISSNLITHMTQIRTEYTLQSESKSYIHHTPHSPYDKLIIVDIDLDFRAPEMGISNMTKTIKQVQSIINHADLITIASSPYFIDQHLALSILHQLLWSDH